MTAKAFGAANRACKVTEASWYGEHWEATRGTPLLPRDLMLAFMYGRAVSFINQDGKAIYSMAARADVSKSLDVLGSTPGMVLQRGERYWEVKPPNIEDLWQIQSDEEITTPIPFYSIPVDPEKSDVRIFAKAVTASTSNIRTCQVSSDGGATWWTGSSDYFYVRQDGSHTVTNDIPMHTAVSAGVRSGFVEFAALALLAPLKPVMPLSHGVAAVFLDKSPDPITHIRVINRGSGNLTGGRIIVWKR